MASMLPERSSGSQPQAASKVMEQPTAEQKRQHGSSWVQCSACRLWRRVPKELSQRVEGENMTWCVQRLRLSQQEPESVPQCDQPCSLHLALVSICRYCRENPDPGHASCSVPQEMSDAAIDTELAQNTQEVRPYCKVLLVPTRLSGPGSRLLALVGGG